MGAREKFRKQRRFYLDGYAQYPESFTWHYEMLQAIKNPSTASQTIKFDSASQDAFGRLRTSQPFTIFDSNSKYSLNESQWINSTDGAGSISFDSTTGSETLSVTGIGKVMSRTNKYIAYQPGKSLLIMTSFNFGQTAAGIKQQIGYFDLTDGVYVQLSGNQLSFVKRQKTGASSSQEFIVDQQDWNVDKLDGTGPSGYTFDITKVQIFFTDIEWLGSGTVRMGFIINGNFILCHTFEHANVTVGTYMSTGTLPITYYIESTSGASSDMKKICSTAISEGGYELLDSKFSIHTPISTPVTFSAADTFYPIISARVKASNLGAVAVLTNLSLTGLGSGKYYSWRLTLGESNVTGGTWSGSGVVEYNTTATSVSGTSKIIASGFVTSSNQGSPVINLNKDSLFGLQFLVNNSPEFTTESAFEFTLEVSVNSVSGSEGIYGSMDWAEVVK